MIKEYFNKFELEKILKLNTTNPYLALKKYEEYISTYPKDYCAYCMYIDLLLTIGKLDEADQMIDKVKELSRNDNVYLADDKKLDLLNKRIHYLELKLLFFKGDYEGAYQYRNLYKNQISEFGTGYCSIICKKKMGILDEGRENGHTYAIKQCIDYSDKDFLEHMKRHFIDTDEKAKVENYFISDFPFLEVINEIKKYIPSKKGLNFGIGSTSYYFKYDGCGRIYRKNLGFIRVECFYETNNIITMYPIDYGDDLPYVDLNYMIKNNEKINEPKDDRITRFYKRLEKSKK